jgi:multiple sugar transport system permease protein
MPIISNIGKRSFKVRALYASIYAVLIIGAATMIYPLLLMLAGSVKSEADSWSITPYPEFWFNDTILFQKYIDSKYNGGTALAQAAWNVPVTSWRSMENPVPVEAQWIAAFRDWRAARPAEVRSPGHIAGYGVTPRNLRGYRKKMARLFANDLDAYNRAANQLFTSWSSVRPPALMIGRYPNPNIPDAFRQTLLAWFATLPPEDDVVSSEQGRFAMEYLRGCYTTQVEAYNQAHGTAYASFSEIPFSDRAPAEPGLQRQDWETYVRSSCALDSIRLDPGLVPAFGRYLARTHGSAARFNKLFGTDFASLEAIPFPARLQDAPFLRSDLDAFLKDADLCPIDAVRVVDSAQRFEAFLRQRHGRLPEGYPGFGPIVAAVDWADCLTHAREWRREFTTRNYAMVLDFILLHGNALRNTVIYCVLAVLTALIVNPLAAYALSRFKLPGTYKILLFCMATMAFPGEVAMIPGFMLRKRFPLWPLLGGLAVCLAVFLLLERWRPRWKENRRALLSLAAGLLTGGVLIPRLAPAYATVSLLNTFAALVLPGMANGYSIFLLKGFFDSQPKELYEAADIDGANEWVKFWTLTMNLSKPILAVIALGAFASAYSNFMMALIIIPDQKMWTLMVWIFQLQSEAHQSVVYASLVIAAIPTFLVFVFCQNIIMRGIVVPTEK